MAGGPNLPDAGRRALIAFPVVTVVLLMSPAIRLLVFFFPVMAVLLAAGLYRRNVPGYVTRCVGSGFSLRWCAACSITACPGGLSPLRSNWLPPSRLHPPAVAHSRLAQVLQRRAAPLLCIVAVCIYATFLGLLNFAPRLVFRTC